MRSTTLQPLEHNSYQVGESLFCHRILHIRLSKACVYAKANLYNYKEFTTLREHI
jgi:hypothetical protein